MLTRQRTQLSNAIRGHMAEYGLVAPVGRNGLQRLITILDNPDDDRVPEMARVSLAPLVTQLGLLNDQVLENDRRVRASARSTGSWAIGPSTRPPSKGSNDSRMDAAVNTAKPAL